MIKILLIGFFGLMGFNVIVSSFNGWQWIARSIRYPFFKRKVSKLFARLTETQRRDLWLYSEMDMDESKWYNRKLEQYIRNKYINPIIEKYGSVRNS
jgi:hypothetical protein